MDLGSIVFLLGILVVMVVAIAIGFVVKGYSGAKLDLSDGPAGKSKKKSTIFLGEREDDEKCDICYGKIEDNPLAICSCGKKFHEACARPTGSCPYCGAKYDSMEIREPERTLCPGCHKPVRGNMCHDCKIMIPKKDHTFICKCGNTVDAGKPVCRKCGAIYELRKVDGKGARR